MSCSSYQPIYELWPSFDASDPSAAQGNGGAAGQTQSGAGSAGRGGTTIGEPGGSTGGSDDEPVDPGTGGSGGSAGVGGTTNVGGSGGTTRRDGGVVDAGANMDAGREASSVVVRMDAGPSTSTSGCSLTVSLTTASNGGRYAPRNIGAIWIANGSGRFVKTLAAWARTRIGYLTQWTSVSSAAGLNRNTVDAVTGATLASHQAHNVTWNCKDTTGAVVPDGAYQLGFEMTDNSSTGPRGMVNFTKGAMPFQMTAPDTTTFKSISLRFTP